MEPIDGVLHAGKHCARTPPHTHTHTLEALCKLIHMGVNLLVPLALSPLPTQVVQLLVQVVQFTLETIALCPVNIQYVL